MPNVGNLDFKKFYYATKPWLIDKTMVFYPQEIISSLKVNNPIQGLFIVESFLTEQIVICRYFIKVI